jgi:choline-sulfatase
MSDEHNPNVLGCYGDPIVGTPNIDSLAATGVRFANAYCQHPLCVPSRSALMTGRYCFELGAWDNGSTLPDDVHTMGHHFAEGGYVTGASGKMHIIGKDKRLGFKLRPLGDAGADVLWKAAEDVRRVAGAVCQPAVAGPSDDPLDTFQDYQVTQAALRMLKENRDRPFMFWVSYIFPHFPFVSPEVYFNRYRGRMRLPKVTEDEISRLPVYLQKYREQHQWAKLTGTQILTARAAYYGNVNFIDDEVGKLLKVLDELGLRNNTIVVYTTDHGEMLGEHGLWRKNCFYEQSVRVPLIISNPACLTKGKVVTEVVEQFNLLPTISELCGLDAPIGISARSMVSLMRGEEKKWREVAFSEYEAHPLQSSNRMIRTRRWKYNWFELNSPQLFDMKEDPDELHNLADTAEGKKVVPELEKLVPVGWKGRPRRQSRQEASLSALSAVQRK